MGTRLGYVFTTFAEDLSVACPSCGSEAIFTSPYGYFQDDAAKEAVAAVVAGRLNGVKFGGGFAFERFPHVFPWRDPNNPFVHYERREPWGVVSCGGCAYRKKHLLNWPDDAFWRVELPVGVLWACTRGHLVGIRRYVSGEDRRGGAFDRIPKEFLLKRNVERVLRGIDQVLGSTRLPNKS